MPELNKQPVAGVKQWKYDCHTGSKFAFSDPVSGIKIYGGGLSRNFKQPKDGLTIDLSGSADQYHPECNYNSVFFAPKRTDHRIIRIAVQDFKAATEPKEFWLSLVKEIRLLKVPVYICCQGGHGRTGMALAILAGLTGKVKKADPVEFIRTVYCNQAIETKDQISYIVKMTGLSSKSKERESHWGTVGAEEWNISGKYFPKGEVAQSYSGVASDGMPFGYDKSLGSTGSSEYWTKKHPVTRNGKIVLVSCSDMTDDEFTDFDKAEQARRYDVGAGVDTVDHMSKDFNARIQYGN